MNSETVRISGILCVIGYVFKHTYAIYVGLDMIHMMICSNTTKKQIRNGEEKEGVIKTLLCL